MVKNFTKWEGKAQFLRNPGLTSNKINYCVRLRFLLLLLLLKPQDSLKNIYLQHANQGFILTLGIGEMRR